MKKLISKIKKSCHNFMTGKSGFSLVELIVVIAIMAVMAAVLAPALLGYVEKSRMQKDSSAMDEVVNAMQLSLADQEIYDEVLEHSVWDNVSCYIDQKDESQFSNCKVQLKAANGDKKEQYMFGDEARLLDETVYYAAGNMRGLTITFSPSEDGDTYDFANGILNKFVGRKTGLLSENPELYNRLRSVIGDKLDTTSQTYRNSDYTIFIRVGSTGGSEAVMQDAIQVWGQFNGTNLAEKDHKFELSSGRVVGDAGRDDELNNNYNHANSDTSFSETPVYSEFSGMFEYEGGPRYQIIVNGQSVDATWENLLKGNYVTVNNGELSKGANASQLKGVLIVDQTVKKIVDSKYNTHDSFLYGSTVQHVIFEDGIVEIGAWQIYHNNNLQTITIPKTVSTIGDGFAVQCNGLQNIIVNEENDKYSSHNGVLYSKDNTVLIAYPRALSGAYDVLDGTTKIVQYAFSNSKVTSVNLPSSLVIAETQAFDACGSLTTVKINSNCTISYATFRNCPKLNITLNNNNRYVFENGILFNKNKTTIVAMTTVPDTVVIPEGVKIIQTSSAGNQINIKTLILPKSLQEIGSHNGFQTLENICYQGTVDDWQNVQMKTDDGGKMAAYINNAHFTYNYEY